MAIRRLPLEGAYDMNMTLSEWGVRWDAISSDGAPWNPVEQCDTIETAQAVAATSIRPWSNPRVVHREDGPDAKWEEL